MSEIRQLIERLKHGKHDQSTHGRRGRRGGGGGGGGGGASSGGGDGGASSGGGDGGASSGGSSKPPKPPKQTEYQKYVGKRDAKLQKAGLKPRSYDEAYQAAKNAEREINRVFHSGHRKAPLNTEVSTIQGSFDGDMPTGHYGFLSNRGIKWSGRNRLSDMQQALRLAGISSKYVDDGQIIGLVVSNTYDYGS